MNASPASCQCKSSPPASNARTRSANAPWHQSYQLYSFPEFFFMLSSLNAVLCAVGSLMAASLTPMKTLVGHLDVPSKILSLPVYMDAHLPETLSYQIIYKLHATNVTKTRSTYSFTNLQRVLEYNHEVSFSSTRHASLLANSFQTPLTRVLLEIEGKSPPPNFRTFATPGQKR